MKTPDHYTSAKTPIERLPEVYKEGFIIGNIIKYASRAGLKDSFEDDLNKCLHYCQMLMELRAGKVSNDLSSNRIKQFAELLQEPKPVYNQPQIADHPEPKGEVHELQLKSDITYVMENDTVQHLVPSS